jgi:peptidoglycan hydrolase-like protein with peptidoglycan-binding domain
MTVAALAALLVAPSLPLAASAAGLSQPPTQVAQSSAPAQSKQHHTPAKSHKPVATSAHVKSAQEALNKHGAQLVADGKMGPKTHAAIRDFQKSNNLKVTGKLDSATQKALGI